MIAALILLAIIAGNPLVEWFTRFCGKRTTLLLWAAVIQTVAVVGVRLAGSFWLAVALYLAVMATWGVWTPVKQDYLHQLVPSEQRAKMVSLDSLVGSAGAVCWVKRLWDAWLRRDRRGWLCRGRADDGSFMVGAGCAPAA